VTITSTTEGANIHFTTTGVAPTTSSPIYTEPFWINRTTTVSAMATNGIAINSEVRTATFTFTVETPMIMFAETDTGIYVTITCATDGATIHYAMGNFVDNLDASSPIYTEPFRVTGTSATVMVKAVGMKDGWTNSLVATLNNIPNVTSNQNLIDQLSLKVYPNPTDDYVNIEYSGNAKLSLFNVNGVLVYEGTMNGHIKLSLAEFSCGIFVLRVVSDEGTAIERIIRK
jgi:hypothetical protein